MADEMMGEEERKKEALRRLIPLWLIPPSFRCSSTTARALPAFPPLYKYLTEVEADERRKEGRNASIKKIVVIAIIAAAAAAVITFIIDDVQRQEEQEEGISPSFHVVIPTTAIEANENCRRNSRYFHFWTDSE